MCCCGLGLSHYWCRNGLPTVIARMISNACLGSASSSSASPVNLTCLFRNAANLSSPGSKPRVALTSTSCLYSMTSLSLFKPSLSPSACTSSPWHTAVMSMSTFTKDVWAGYALYPTSLNQARNELYLQVGSRITCPVH